MNKEYRRSRLLLIKRATTKLIVTLIVNYYYVFHRAERRTQQVGHFINDRRISARGRLSLLMFTATLTVTSLGVWVSAFFMPREFSTVMVTFHTASLYAIWKIKPYKI